MAKWQLVMKRSLRCPVAAGWEQEALPTLTSVQGGAQGSGFNPSGRGCLSSSTAPWDPGQLTRTQPLSPATPLGLQLMSLLEPLS